MPWCVNEGVEVFVNEVAFESAKSSINDCSSIPDKNHQFTGKINAYWKIVASMSALDRSTLECVILMALVKCTRLTHKMMHSSVLQPRMFERA